MTSTAFTRIYLNDHRAGAAGGLALARRTAANNRATELGTALDELAGEIADDVTTLDAIIDALEVKRDPFKMALARAGEWAGRAKLNGRLRGYSPLSRLVEVEMLIAGVEAKRRLWESLHAAALPQLANFHLEALLQRAQDQLATLARIHRVAASQALADPHCGDVSTNATGHAPAMPAPSAAHGGS